MNGLAAAHDQPRGVPGSFDAAIGAMLLLRRADVQVSVNTQINRLSSADLEPLLECLLQEGIWAWGVQLTMALGRAAGHPDWLLQPYELLDLFPRLAKLKLSRKTSVRASGTGRASFVCSV